MIILWSYPLIIFLWLLANCYAASVITPIQFDDEGPFSSNKNPESAYVASLANIAYRSINLPSTCTSLGIESSVCEIFSSTVSTKMNIYWAKSENKTDLRVISSSDKTLIGSENRNVLAIKSTTSSPVFIFFFGEHYGYSQCLRDHGRIVDHGRGKCLVYCVHRINYSSTIRTNICFSNSLPSTHFAGFPPGNNDNLIRCVDGILGAATC